MITRINIWLFLLLAGTTGFGQLPSFIQQAGVQANTFKPDTIYYPFYHGAQMIEIDYANAWIRDVDYHEGTQPRALRWCDLIPKPPPNIYLMRDSTGHIFRAFNTATSLKDLEKNLIDVRSSKKIQVTHQQRFILNRRYAHELTPWKFRGHYLVHTVNPDHEASINNNTGKKTGMIDSLGHIVFPIIYEFVDEAGDNFLVKKDRSFGIISKESK
ncbi:MAG: hypothetical protein ACKO5C_00790, partial [Ferruginibacter sp.]